MKIKFCGIGQISFVENEKTYVGEVVFQIHDEALPEMQRIGGHDLEMTVRVKGDASWPFEHVQAEILTKSASLLSLASEHIGGATILSLAEYNARMDAEDEAARQADLAEALSGNA